MINKLMMVAVELYFILKAKVYVMYHTIDLKIDFEFVKFSNQILVVTSENLNM